MCFCDCFPSFPSHGRDRKHHLSDDRNPLFHRAFEMTTTLPGISNLAVEVWDADTYSTDDFIGRTVIDLEDRWYDDRWQQWGANG